MTAAAVIRGFSLATVFGASLAVFRRNLVPFLLLAALLTAPSYLHRLLVPGPDSYRDIDLYFLRVVAIGFVCGTLAQAALVYGTVQELRGQHPSPLACLWRGIAVMLPAVGVGLSIAFVLGLGVLMTFAAGVVTRSITGTLVVFALMLIPGLMLLTRWWVAVPVAVIERPGVLASLSRSTQLTEGRRWPILAIVVLFAVLSLLESQLVQQMLALILHDGLGRVAAEAIGIATGTVVTAFTCVVIAVGYFVLRADKDGLDPGSIAAVFD
jgi:hypothetical protein